MAFLLSGNSSQYREVILFLLKALLIYLTWYVMYTFWILPDGRLDQLVSRNIVSVTASMLRFSGYEVFAFDRVVGIGLSRGLEIINGCNGIETIGLFAGFIAAYPGNRTKRWLFLPFGILVIYLVNVLRVFFLAILQHHQDSLFHFVHDYTFNLIFYLVVFLLWMIWALFGGEKPAVPASDDTEAVSYGV